MKEKKATDAVSLFSIISMGISGMGILAILLAVGALFLGGSGGSSTAITNEAVIGIAGFILLIGCSAICGVVGTISGVVMTIITIVKKKNKTIWIPILSVVIGLLPFALAILLFVLIS